MSLVQEFVSPIKIRQNPAFLPFEFRGTLDFRIPICAKTFSQFLCKMFLDHFCFEKGWLAHGGLGPPPVVAGGLVGWRVGFSRWRVGWHWRVGWLAGWFFTIFVGGLVLLAGWLVGGLIGLAGWLGWRVGWAGGLVGLARWVELAGWLAGGLVGLAGWLAGGLVGWRVGWAGGLVGWRVGWLAGWFCWRVGWLAGWLVGGLVGGVLVVCVCASVVIW